MIDENTGGKLLRLVMVRTPCMKRWTYQLLTAGILFDVSLWCIYSTSRPWRHANKLVIYTFTHFFIVIVIYRAAFAGRII